MKKAINISIIFIILLVGCSQSKKDKVITDKSNDLKNSIENVKLELDKLIIESIDSTVFRDYSIEFITNASIDSLTKSHLTFWTLENTKLTDKERLLLKSLIESDKNYNFNVSDLIKEKLSKSNQLTDNQYIKNLNKIAIDSSQNVALTIIGTYFTSKRPESRISGWEEIVVFEKIADKWRKRKEVMYVEY
ncbi:hypothetical protein [Flavobacterium sp. CS20]|uniref:hypothetical protein n=1 Tax=Flavobacterium sp. CS20 TaxID=2775246 RepID=UPI001B3A0E98|nr:hypothetical protein [Flavobacterium sp. CS20]QTY27892.1 hypothetical protein IGB25_05130 [Flavobacterium sp. CS20]